MPDKPNAELPATIANAKQLEAGGELKKAAAMYETLLKNSKSSILILTRLMVLYRKLKNYKKELVYISRIIGIHEKRHSSIKKYNAKVGELSKKLNLLLGHIDKKGKKLLAPDEITKLQKRKDNVAKKLGM